MRISSWDVETEDGRSGAVAGSHCPSTVSRSRNKCTRPSVVIKQIMAADSPILSSCTLISDSSSTNNDNHPHAATLDIPKSFTIKEEHFSDDDVDYPDLYLDPHDSTADLGLTTHIARSAYEPPSTFWNQSSLLQLTSASLPPHRRRTLKDEIRLSTATLELMTSAHRLMSNETHAIKTAAADLFNRCERMMEELRTQIQRVREVNGRVEQLVLGGGDEHNSEGERSASERLGSRAQKCLERQEKLTDRMEKLRRRAVKFEGRAVGEKEREWTKEMASLEQVICRHDEDDDEDDFMSDAKGHGRGENGNSPQPFYLRYEGLRDIGTELLERAKHVKEEEGGKTRANEDGYGISNDIRKRKVQQVMALLEREEALVEGVMMRLERLKVV